VHGRRSIRIFETAAGVRVAPSRAAGDSGNSK
jgi:hypothetical protein